MLLQPMCSSWALCVQRHTYKHVTKIAKILLAWNSLPSPSQDSFSLSSVLPIPQLLYSNFLLTALVAFLKGSINLLSLLGVSYNTGSAWTPQPVPQAGQALHRELKSTHAHACTLSILQLSSPPSLRFYNIPYQYSGISSFWWQQKG